MKNKIILFIAFILISLNAFSRSQEDLQIGNTYKIYTNLSVNEWSSAGSCDASKTFIICKNNSIKIQQIIGDKYIIEPKSFFERPGECDITVTAAGTYCIDKQILENSITTHTIQVAVGIITIPFKYEFKTAKVYSGGSIGVGLGFRHVKGPFVMFNGGYSRIPLNNLNATNPVNVNEVGALTYGLAIGHTIKKFQIALVFGSDRYNISDEKQHKNWMSIAFGFSILKDPKDQ